LNLAAIALVAVPLAGIWAWISFQLGRRQTEWAKEFDCQSWGQFFLKFVVSHPAVTCAIPATSKVHHMTDNMAVNFGKLPSPSMRKRMLEYYAAL